MQKVAGLHEARHLGGKDHDAFIPPWADGAGRWGADSSWEYQGAWKYETLYLWWFYQEGARTTPALRQKARQRANFNIDNRFDTRPGFTITNYRGLP